MTGAHDESRRSRLMRSFRSTRQNMKKRFRTKRLDVQLAVKRKLRQVIAGDPNASLRKFALEPPQLKLKDKAAFTVSVMNVLGLQYTVITSPEYFHLYWIVTLIPLMVWRYFDYRVKKWQYFMLDLCYFTNVLLGIQTCLWPDNHALFLTVFALANGPVLWGTVVWRNSMVFHSIDYMTSTFLHICPALVTYCRKWLVEEGSSLPPATWSSMLFNFTLAYATWNVLYCFQTEIVDRDFLDADMTISTSTRWMVQDTKHVITSNALKYLRRAGFYESNEGFDARTFKTKFWYFTIMFAYALITAIPLKLLYESRTAHLISFLLVTACSVFNGASYYVEVFSERYADKLRKRATQLEKLFFDVVCEEVLDTQGESDCSAPDDDDDRSEESSRKGSMSSQEGDQDEGELGFASDSEISRELNSCSPSLSSCTMSDVSEL